MDTLDSPLEALAINYLSFGFLAAVNNIWAWVAVITAAVSVWRIRASTPRGKSVDESSLLTCFSSPQPQPLSSSSVIDRVEAELAEAEDSTSRKSAASVFQREGRTSGKFIVYYRDEEDDSGNDDGNDDLDGFAGGGKEGEEWLWNSFEVTMKMRMGDKGWYRYQDLRVLDGNVVRLWDDCRRRNAAP